MEQRPETPATGRRQEELAIQYAPWAELEGGGERTQSRFGEFRKGGGTPRLATHTAAD